MKRRNFVWLSLAGAATLALRSLQCSNDKAAMSKILAQPEVLSRFCDAKTLQEIGDGYRKKQPAEDSEDHLQGLLLRDNAGQSINTTTDMALIRGFIRQQVEEDFKAGRLTKIKGWIISQTEARQCALFSLI